MEAEADVLSDRHQCFFLREGYIQIKNKYSALKQAFTEASEDIEIKK